MEYILCKCTPQWSINLKRFRTLKDITKMNHVKFGIDISTNKETIELFGHQCLRPKWHPIPYIVHYFWPGPIGSKAVHYKAQTVFPQWTTLHLIHCVIEAMTETSGSRGLWVWCAYQCVCTFVCVLFLWEWARACALGCLSGLEVTVATQTRRHTHIRTHARVQACSTCIPSVYMVINIHTATWHPNNVPWAVSRT